MPTFSCHNEEDYNELNRAFTNATWRLNDLNEDLLNYQMGLHTLSEVVSEKEKIAAGWVLRYDNKKSIYDAVVLRKIEHEAKVSSITIQIKQLTWIASLSCGCEEDNLAKMKVIEEKLELELKDHVAQVILLEVAITDIKNEEDPFGEEVCMEANRLVLEAKQELDKEEKWEIEGKLSIHRKIDELQEYLSLLAPLKYKYMLSSRMENLEEFLSTKRDGPETEQICESFDVFLDKLMPDRWRTISSN